MSLAQKDASQQDASQKDDTRKDATGKDAAEHEKDQDRGRGKDGPPNGPDQSGVPGKEDDATKPTRVVSVGTLVKSVLVTVLAVAVVAVIGILSWQLAVAKSDLSERDRQGADRARAEQVALDYAVGAADMNYQDPGAWRERLTEGTSPELAERLNKAATSMDQIIQPLQWTTVSEPIAAKVESSSDGVYQVVAFVDMLTTNTQRPEGVQSTATYRMTIDGGQDWQITDISELASALGEPEQPGN